MSQTQQIANASNSQSDKIETMILGMNDLEKVILTIIFEMNDLESIIKAHELFSQKYKELTTIFTYALIQANFQRNDYYKSDRKHGVEDFVQSDYFDEYFTKEIIPAIIKGKDLYAPQEIKSGKKSLKDFKYQDWFNIGGMLMLPLLFQIQTPEALKLLKGFLDLPVTILEIINPALIETSLPYDRDGNLAEKEKLKAYHLLNVYAKLSIIDENAAYNMALKTLQLPNLNVITFCQMLKDLAKKCFNIDQGSNLTLLSQSDDEQETNSPTIISPETQELRQAFLNELPKSVQEKLYGIGRNRERPRPTATSTSVQ